MTKINQEDLANRLLNYAKDFDTYEYRDLYNNDEEAYNDMLESTSKDKIDSTIEWLANDLLIIFQENDITNPDTKRLSKEAYDLLCDLNIYSKELDKDISL